MINLKIDQSDMIYSKGTKTRQKISESRDEHIFFTLDYVLDSLQRSSLYVNDKKSSITRENAFLMQNEHLFLVKSNIDSNRRKMYSLASKTPKLKNPI